MTKKLRHFILIWGYFIAFFCCSSLPVRADWFAPIRNYEPHTYAAGTQNWMLRQHPCGWIYAANNYGVLEYDGNRWTLYGQYGSTVTRCIAIGAEGTIYAGATNEFGIFQADPHGKLTYKPLQTPEMGSFGEVWNIVAQAHDLYVQAYHHIFHRNSSGRWSIIRSSDILYQMQAINGAVFVSSERGLSLLSGDQLVFISGSEVLRGTEVRSLCAYGQNQVLIASSRGLYIYNGTSVEQFKTQADEFLRSNQIYCCAVGTDHIAIGSVLGGLVLTDLQGNNPQYRNTHNGLQNNTILSLLFDQSGNLWVGLDQGIDCILLESCVASLYSSQNSRGSGYSFCMTKEHTYYGTNQGLFCGKNPVSFSDGTADLNLVAGSAGQVWSLDKAGNALFCSHTHGLYEVQGDKLQPIFTNQGCWQVLSLPSSAVKDSGKQQSASLLAGTYDGFRILSKKNGHWQASPILKGYNETCRDFEVDNNGQIWMVGSQGLDRLTISGDLQSLKVKTVKRKVDANDFLNIFKIGSEILITSRSWCGVVDQRGQFHETDRIVRNLEGVRLYDFVARDPDMNLWYIVDDRLMVRLYDRNKKTYAPSSTLLTDIPRHYVSGFANLSTVGKGRAVVATVSGFEIADVNRALMRAKTSIHPIIRRVTVSNTDSLVFSTSYQPSTQPVSLRHTENNLRIDYGAGVTSSGLVEYNVCLSPLESENDVWTPNTTKEYTDLPPGEYTFRLRVRIGEQIETIELPFEIKNPWYATPFMRILYVILTVLFIFWAGKHIYLRIQREQQRLAKEKDIEILELQKVQAEANLHNKEQELSNALLSQVARNELISDMQNDLQKIAQDLQIRDNQHALKRLANMQGKLTRNMESQLDWSKFEQNYDQVNNNFLQKLGERYPTLTGNERRLCVYIRMGLQNKEIAPIMNISVRGVEMMRYRMRRKMELNQATSLDSHLQII